MKLALHPPRDSRRFDGFYLGKDGVPVQPGASLPEPLGEANGDLVIYVNGINTDVEKQLWDMKNISRTGRRVLGVHNATAGTLRDLGECLADKVGFGENPAVDTVKALIKQGLDSGRQVALVAHSQGGLVCSRALWELQDEEMTGGLSFREVKNKLSHVSLETAGAAAYQYPKGPAYFHQINTLDPVPFMAGLGSGVPGIRPGQGSRVEFFTDARKPYRKPGESWFSAAVKSFDRCLHGTDVYYSEERAEKLRSNS